MSKKSIIIGLASLLVVATIALLVVLRMEGSACGTEQGGGFKIIRYDRLVEDYAATGNVALWQRLNTEFPLETQALVENVLRLGPIDAEGIEDSLCAFYASPSMHRLRADVSRRFEDLSDLERPLGEAFCRLSQELPGFVVPKVYTQISAFNESVVVGDSLIGISLDKYMGADYPLYAKCFYANQRATMVPGRIVQDCLLFYLNQLSRPKRPDGQGETLLDCMLQQGKLNWIVAHVTHKPLVNVAAVTPATKSWYKSNERRVWQILCQRNLLASTDAALIHAVVYSADARPYFSDPYSRGVGLWVGMRIVDSYMKRHPEVTLADLFAQTDYAAILRESGFQ